MRSLIDPAISAAPSEDFGNLHFVPLHDVHGTEVPHPKPVEDDAVVLPAVLDIRLGARAEGIDFELLESGPEAFPLPCVQFPDEGYRLIGEEESKPCRWNGIATPSGSGPGDPRKRSPPRFS